MECSSPEQYASVQKHYPLETKKILTDFHLHRNPPPSSLEREGFKVRIYYTVVHLLNSFLPHKGIWYLEDKSIHIMLHETILMRYLFPPPSLTCIRDNDGGHHLHLLTSFFHLYATCPARSISYDFADLQKN